MHVFLIILKYPLFLISGLPVGIFIYFQDKFCHEKAITVKYAKNLNKNALFGKIVKWKI